MGPMDPRLQMRFCPPKHLRKQTSKATDGTKLEINLGDLAALIFRAKSKTLMLGGEMEQLQNLAHLGFALFP